MYRNDSSWTQLRERVRTLYDQPPRAYHNWSHVEACLRELSAVRSLCADPDALEVAIWLHDCIYDPQRHDNEEQSATLARKWLAELLAPSSFIDTVAQLILVTKHNAIPASPDGKLIVDIDLSILGQAPEVFDAYERAIRQEYSFVPDEAFRAGRTCILQGFLDRPKIYCTQSFQGRYERAARANLARSIEQLVRR